MLSVCLYCLLNNAVCLSVLPSEQCCLSVHPSSGIVSVSLQVRGVKKAGKRSANKKGSKKASGARSKTSKKSNLLTYGGDDLSQKIYTTMEKHKEVCHCGSY